ncbi:hypothetical protein LTR70_003798 [Exophiala xenobiotica]|uniref:Uncharacterized protein n=1 Tax=Lithohypha guttulata TaxID=1690604 RepID=A0ABR0KG64_9EURO|nr:hypothetical protein LTR24_003335 [Lithohypha guttulata]KAK5322297.1 hypothetical protein LTR70_003798 [Exophiala xenobiotica]
MPVTPKKQCTQNDMQVMIDELKYAASDAAKKEVKARYNGLFCKTNMKILSKKWHLIFGTREGEELEVPEDLLNTLVGPDWKKRQANLYRRLAIDILDENGVHVDLSDVRTELALSKFNILQSFLHPLG